MTQHNQWIRKIGLLLSNANEVLDLSEFRIKFSIQNADVESPNSCAIRVYNLSKKTLQSLKKYEFQDITLNAGYQTGNYGAIFKGSIKQFKIGKENATDTYLDILCADGDTGYNQGFLCETVAAGATPAQLAARCAGSMPKVGLDIGSLTIDKQHVPNIRGVVLFGMARARLRGIANTLDSSWSIQNGKVTLIQNTGYLEGEAVVINTATGMVGIPEQTDSGIKVKCLLNSRLRIGGLVQLNESEIVQLMQANPNAAAIPYNQWAGIQYNAALSPDGFYRAFAVEHSGDTRGQEWYSEIICLAVDRTAVKNNSVGAS
jgi:hypothetical protein